MTDQDRAATPGDMAIEMFALDTAGTLRHEDAMAVSRNGRQWSVRIAVVDPDGYVKFIGRDGPVRVVVLHLELDAENGPSLRSVTRQDVLLARVYDISKVDPDVPAGCADIEILRQLVVEVYAGEPLGHLNHWVRAILADANAACAAWMIAAGHDFLHRNPDDLSGPYSTCAAPPGSPVYGRFSKPLRRLEDWANLACLLAAWEGRAPPHADGELEALAAEMSCPRRASVCGDLETMTQWQFSSVVGSAEKGMPPDVEDEFRFRLQAGALDVRTAAAALARKATWPCESLREEIVSALDPAAYGDFLSLCKAPSRATLSGRQGSSEASVRTRDGSRLVATGPSPDVALREALLMAVSSLAGVHPWRVRPGVPLIFLRVREAQAAVEETLVSIAA